MKKSIFVFIIFAALFLIGVSTSGMPGLPRTPKLPPHKNLPDSSFSQDDYEKLLALQFENYEDMTISDYRSRAAKQTDTPEYRNLLDRFSQSESLYEKKDTDETAAFLFYVLEPLTAEKWKSWDYSGQAVSDFPDPEENARVEYVFTLTILNADTLTIREYNAARLSVIDGMENMLKNKTKEELQDTNQVFMLAAIQADTNRLIKRLQTEKIGLSIEYAYFPLSSLACENQYEHEPPEETAEQRRYPNGTTEDYRTLLALKTPDYQNQPLTDFNSALLDWANEHSDGMERISEDAGWNDFPVPLTAEELSFIKLTIFLSGMENGKMIQALYTGTEPAAPSYSEELPQKTINTGGPAWCSLYYQFSYHISAPKTVTVGERDRQITAMIRAIHEFWNTTDIERLLQMTKTDMAAKLKSLASANSTANITITITEDQIHFERMDERQDGLIRRPPLAAFPHA